ncbi:NAD(P)-binding protein [Lentithecium fluviatile CBS 122367]|uniref:NAD(P)-binding protein n=1 Tax=Lentithecium fluviatile CBS 122367 TaxID=1168545 RepID=A0A6G1J8C7_9PLEO|nr:NAD(P)-binding protein [Lentithecium fluviatile CBS 122367]
MPTVLITGCSDGGIGSALATVFQQRGYHVLATTRDIAKMSAISALPNVTLLKLDVTKPEDIKAAANAVSERTDGKLDVLISNAAINHFMPMLDEDIARAKALFDTNTWGPVALTQAFATLLIKAKGMAVFITSISGYVNTPYMSAYAASKRSIEIIAETLRLELKPFGVDVLSVVTGAVKSMGQTYFDDFALPENSLYKPIEDIIGSRARGNDGMPRMDTNEYATAVVDAIAKRTTGRFWYGEHADLVKQSTTATHVLQDAMDAGSLMGNGLEKLQ